LVSKKYPPRAAAIEMIEAIDASPETE
jgi:hypothetical protein